MLPTLLVIQRASLSCLIPGVWPRSALLVSESVAFLILLSISPYLVALPWVLIFSVLNNAFDLEGKKYFITDMPKIVNVPLILCH